ncbi:MAG: hypothetical protein J0H19_03535 [Rhodospirillales bacterium]|nr:hypothetical protein [Rhodospirillales bacterium]MBN8905115.1 hypothetical protein [Rhodospirillales bacterium]MBN8925673.1 hypothetical protein [Rhodospirillales bacterium]
MIRHYASWREQRRFDKALRWHIRHHRRISDGGLDFALLLRRAGVAGAYDRPELYWPLLWAFGALWKGSAIPPPVTGALQKHLSPDQLEAVAAAFREAMP